MQDDVGVRSNSIIEIEVADIAVATPAVYLFSEKGPPKPYKIYVTRNSGRTWMDLKDYRARRMMFRHKGRRKRGRKNYPPAPLEFF